MNFQMYKVDLEKVEETEIKLPTSVGSYKKQGNSRKTSSTSASLTTLKPLTVDHNKLWKILKEMRVSDHLTCLLRNLYVGQETKLESYIEQLFGSKLGKEYDKAVYGTLLTFVQSTSCKMLGWVNHKLESQLLGEITTSDMQMIPL